MPRLFIVVQSYSTLNELQLPHFPQYCLVMSCRLKLRSFCCADGGQPLFHGFVLCRLLWGGRPDGRAVGLVVVLVTTLCPDPTEEGLSQWWKAEDHGWISCVFAPFAAHNRNHRRRQKSFESVQCCWPREEGESLCRGKRDSHLLTVS